MCTCVTMCVECMLGEGEEVCGDEEVVVVVVQKRRNDDDANG